MYFDNFEALIAMGGHGPYVWSAYAITIAVMLTLVLTPVMRHRRFIREQCARMRREQQHAVKADSTEI